MKHKNPIETTGHREKQPGVQGNRAFGSEGWEFESLRARQFPLGNRTISKFPPKPPAACSIKLRRIGKKMRPKSVCPRLCVVRCLAVAVFIASPAMSALNALALAAGAVMGCGVGAEDGAAPDG